MGTDGKPRIAAALAKLDDIKAALEARATDVSPMVGTLINIGLDSCVANLGGAQAIHDAAAAAQADAERSPA